MRGTRCHDAKLATTILTCTKKSGVQPSKAKLQVRVFPGNNFDDPHRAATIRLKDVRILDPKNFPIPLANDDEWTLCMKVHRAPNVIRLAELKAYAVTRGEINQKVYEDYIDDAPRPGYARLVKGVEIGQYKIHARLSQGRFEWFNERKFLKDHAPRPVADRTRIATQRITGMNERLRVVATIIEPRAYFADSTNSITLEQSGVYTLEYLLAFLNSSLYQWRFKVTSTNNNVGTNELLAMPIRTLDSHDESDAELNRSIVESVREMLEVQAGLSKARAPAAAKEQLEKRAAYLRGRLDKLVYHAFSLGKDDITALKRFAARPAGDAAWGTDSGE